MNADLRRLNGAPPFGSGSFDYFYSDSPIASGFALGAADRLNARPETDRGAHLKSVDRKPNLSA